MNKYTGSIEIPKASLTPILIAALVNHVNFVGMGVKFDEYTFQPGLEDPDIVVFTDDGAENGQFDEMEEFLFSIRFHLIVFQIHSVRYNPNIESIDLLNTT